MQSVQLKEARKEKRPTGQLKQDNRIPEPFCLFPSLQVHVGAPRIKLLLLVGHGRQRLV